MPRADLVLEGGGVKGLGTAGAVLALLEDGYRFERVAGTSVGAVVGAFAAAGADTARLRAILDRLDLRRIPDREVPVPLVGEGLSLLTRQGLYEGDWIHEWLREELAALDVHTFADLRRDDPGDDPGGPVDQRWKLVVMATDVTHGRLLRLPWDYEDRLHLPPDEQPVADAVRMSLSLPFYFRPCTLTDPLAHTTSTIVDGGVLSNFPVEIFDRTDAVKRRWPTFGVRIVPDLPESLGELFPILGLPTPPLLRLLQQVLVTAVVGNDQTHLDRPEIKERTITVDTGGTGITEFDISAEERAALVEAGRAAAQQFLAHWHEQHPNP